jgi:putative transcriptional regulator
MESLEGRLLIASPHLADGNFFRSVVFILRHNEEGAYGLVLNRALDRRLDEVLEHALGRTSVRDDPIFRGGPVDGPLVALHQEKSLGEMDCALGVYACTGQEELVQLADLPESPARFFVGYSGWGPGQLEGELRAGGWLVGEASLDDLFGDDTTVWHTNVTRVGRAILAHGVPKTLLAGDPSTN